MGQYTLDLSGYRPNISDTVADARYLAIVEDYEFGKSKSQNDMFTVFLRIVEGPESGKVIIDRLAITPKALFKIVGFLNGLGMPTPKKRLSINPEAWKNRKVYIDTSHAEPYRGRPGTSQIDGYARYIAPEAEDAPADVPVLEQIVEDVPEAVAEPVQAAVVEDAPAEAVKEFTTGTPAEGDAPAMAVPAKAEPETLSLADINL